MGSQDLEQRLKYVVPSSILRASAETLRLLSGGVREAVVLWIGTERAGKALVQRMVVPQQLASAKHFEVPLDERIRIIRELGNSGEKLLVQLHTHPGRAFHSRVDDRLAIPRHSGAISIVIADFATDWHGDLQRASVNCHMGGGVWSELSSEAVSKLFEMD